MSFSPWPQSLFGRLLAASVAAVLIAQVVALLLIAQEREHFMLQGSVREWTRRITETTLMLAPLDPAHRSDALAQLMAAAPLHPVSTATSQTPLGECVIEFAHDPAKAELTLTLVKKPWLLPEGLLWNGFSETLERCRKEE